MFVFLSCGSKQDVSVINSSPVDGVISEDSLVRQVDSKWHQGSKKYSLKNSKGDVSAHLFFDPRPDFDLKNFYTNFVVETVKDSEFLYRLDMVSGKHYTQHKFCKSSDIWKKIKGESYKPPFTVGVVPRVIDQLGNPQRILVFGDAKEYHLLQRTHFFRTRVVGGYIEQSCPINKCVNTGDWKSRVVFLGVNENDSDFEKVFTAKDLFKVVSQNDIKLFIENGFGYNKVVKDYYPSFRMGAVLGASQAINFTRDHSIVFNSKDLKSLKLQCIKLYDYLWRKVGDPTVKRASVKDSESSFYYEQSLKGRPAENIYSQMKEILKEYEGRVKTCFDYVRYDDINFNRTRHWFMTYLAAFFKLHDLNYRYSCRRQIWTPNSRKNPNYKVSIDKQFSGCTEKSFGKAFDSAVFTLRKLELRGEKSYRYIAYDSGSYGTHNKMYNWVLNDGKKPKCEKEMISEQFPKDMSWGKYFVSPYILSKKKLRF